ncbi:MAG: helix-turn-helix transcriptional regulator [Oscillospiraceae bacterium]|nr:helix-turn-helix transcriptional regulator [Oscillospiraceae bacterium]
MENNVKFNAKQFGDNLKQARTNKGMLAEHIADYINISLVALSKYENGHRVPRIDTVAKIADCLNVPIDQLIKDCLIKE